MHAAQIGDAGRCAEGRAAAAAIAAMPVSLQDALPSPRCRERERERVAPPLLSESSLSVEPQRKLTRNSDLGSHVGRYVCRICLLSTKGNKKSREGVMTSLEEGWLVEEQAIDDLDLE